MRLVLVVFGLSLLVRWCDAQCGVGPAPCGVGGAPFYSAYQAPFHQQQQVPQPQPQLQQPAAVGAYLQQPQQQQAIQYYFPANSYAVPPQLSTTVMSSTDKETTLIPSKSTYDDYEKELEKLQQSATIVKTEESGSGSDAKENEVKATLAVVNSSSVPQSQLPIGQSVTYIREFTGGGGYAPEAYLPKPLPYRPVPFIPRGCPVLPPQFIRPIPYYPRGYFQPVVTQQQQILPMQQPQAAYVTAPLVRPPPPMLLPPPINDCCGKCGAPCKYRSRKNVIALASKIFSAQFVPRRDGDAEDEPKDPKCNSEKLKDIMTRFITRTVALSKRLIQKNAEKEIGGFFSVFCSTEDFSYVARSETFCQLQKAEIICYAFKHQ